MLKTGVVLLAAGGATRMGVPKQLLEFKGQPLIRHVAETALASACRPVVIVLGSEAEAVSRVLLDLPVELVINPRWREGMGTSLHSGISAIAMHGVDGAIVALGDQPLVTAARFDALIAAHHATGKAIVASAYSGTVGVPVLFTRALFPNLLALAPDAGCKGIILGNPDLTASLDCPEAADDIDTPADYQRVQSQLTTRGLAPSAVAPDPTLTRP